jgi:hypothetical protein
LADLTGPTVVAASQQQQTRPGAGPVLRIAVLVDTPSIHHSLHEFLMWAQAEDDIEVAAVVVARPSSQASGGLLGRIDAAVLFLATSVDRSIVRILGTRGHLGPYASYAEAFATVSLDQCDLRCACTTLTAPASDASISEMNAEKLARLNLDILLQCGTSTIPDALASLPRFGVVRFRYGDSDSRLPGFWETYRHLDSVACSIERYSPGRAPELQPLMDARFNTKLLYTLTQSHLYAKAFAHLKRILKHHRKILHANAFAGFAQRPVTDSDRGPRAHQSVLYLTKVLFRLVKFLVFKFVRFEQRWRISVLDGPWRQLELPQEPLLRPPRGKFWADPFLYKHDDRLFCFFEEFDYDTASGHICVSEVHHKTVLRTHEKILTERFHLSFPYIFAFNDQIFMCPECEGTRTIRLYLAVEFPRIWQLAHVLMEDIAAVDTMIFEHGGKWWLLTNMDYSDRRDYSAELYVFYADSPLSRRWLPHPQNPVKIDSAGGRNGGMITECGKLFRIGQRQALAQYGRGASVYEIEVLNERVYKEKLVTEFVPTKSSGILGIHHLSIADGRTAVDFVKREFILWP